MVEYYVTEDENGDTVATQIGADGKRVPADQVDQNATPRGGRTEQKEQQDAFLDALGGKPAEPTVEEPVEPSAEEPAESE